METSRGSVRERFEKAFWKVGEKIDMSYDKNKESMLSFILPTILKQDLEEVCVMYDRNQSQVLREAVSSYIRYVREQYLEQHTG